MSVTRPEQNPIPQPVKKASGPTSYLVLRQIEGTGAEWATVNTVPAASATAAIRAVVAKLTEKDQAGTFVAVPARSWTPVKVSARTTTALVLERLS